MAASLRYIPNPYSSYKSADKPFSKSQECHQILEKAKEWLKENIIKFESLYPPDTILVPYSDPRKKSRDPSIYTGLGGNAYVHWKLVQYYNNEGNKDAALDHLMKGLEAIHNALPLVTAEERGVSFYIGAPGLCTLAALLYHEYQEPIKTESYLTQLLSYQPQVFLSETQDEVLYGRAGYLSCLLMAKQYLPAVMCERVKLEEVMRKVFDAIIQSGQTPKQQYLKYLFYGQDYLGGAHGTGGVLYMLLQCPSEWCKEPTVQRWLTNTLNHIISIQLPDGNFPITDSRRKESRVHWCHGSPGIVPLLYKSYIVYSNDKYLKAMQKGLQCIWQYGILKKGIGLCHGITGNAYPFLLLYQLTSSDEYYYNAVRMGQSVWNDQVFDAISSFSDPQRLKRGTPDCPLSLMEGLGGAICFYCDLLYPTNVAFPGYDVNFN